MNSGCDFTLSEWYFTLMAVAVAKGYMVSFLHPTRSLQSLKICVITWLGTTSYLDNTALRKINQWTFKLGLNNYKVTLVRKKSYNVIIFINSIIDCYS